MVATKPCWLPPYDLMTLDYQGDLALDSRLQRIQARLPVYLKDLRDNPRWVVMFIFGRIVALRGALRTLRAMRYTTARTASSTMFGSVNIVETVKSLERDGLFCGIQLPRNVVDDLRHFAQQTPCYGNISKKMSFFPSDHSAAEARFAQPILIGHYLEKVEDCPRIREIREDPLLKEIASRYLKRRPNILTTRMWWSFPADGLDDGLLRLASQSLHSDINDWSSVKFFFYLNDVIAESGPHVYVRRSHRRKRLRDQLTLFAGKRISNVIDFYGDGGAKGSSPCSRNRVRAFQDNAETVLRKSRRGDARGLAFALGRTADALERDAYVRVM
jgi:hypothetical protein